MFYQNKQLGPGIYFAIISLAERVQSIENIPTGIIIWIVCGNVIMAQLKSASMMGSNFVKSLKKRMARI